MGKKRANGEGNIRKRKDGRWEGRYTAGHDPETGKAIYKNVLGRTQAEAKTKLKAAIEDEGYFQTVRGRVMATRERTAKALTGMGFSVLPSRANFLFVSHPKMAGKVLLDGLREQGILVRWWNDPLISDWLRVTIGTEQEMDELLRVLQELLS